MYVMFVSCECFYLEESFHDSCFHCISVDIYATGCTILLSVVFFFNPATGTTLSQYSYDLSMRLLVYLGSLCSILVSSIFWHVMNSMRFKL